MIIQLQEPFASKWSKGYLQINREGRQTVTLSNPDGTSFGTSYARYLMGVKLGYEVPDHLEVDHRDDDKTNDDIDNLQLLTPEDNRLKEQYNYVMNKQVRYGYHCAYCDKPFILIEAEVKKRLYTGGELAFCSRSCSASYHSIISKRSASSQLSDEEILQIKQLRSQGLSVYKIAKITGFANNTVMKYW